MKNFSATKTTLLMFSLTLCSGFLLGKVSAEIFTVSATLVFGAYFGDKGRPTQNTETTV